METRYTYCSICEHSCGLAVTTENNKVIDIKPDKDNRYSWRDYCVKAGKSHLILDHPDRITKPMKRVGDKYVETTYEEAVKAIGQQLNDIIKAHGKEAIASYTGNPNGFNFGSALFQNLLMMAIGSHNRFWVGSIDQNAIHIVCEEIYGNAWAALQPDVDNCECLLLIGANPAISGMCWVGNIPNGWKRAVARQKDGGNIIVVDPRQTESAAKANQHIAPLPETDWALLLGVLKVIFAEKLYHADCFDRTNDIESLMDFAESTNLNHLSRLCDVPINTIEELARTFAKADGAIAIARTGPSQGKHGVISIWLTHILNVVTGNIDRKGGLYYNKGIVDLLAIGDELFPPNETPSRVRGLPTVAGAHSIAELPDEINTPGKGQIKALFINGGNPVVAGPDGKALDEALEKLDLLVCIDFFQRESHRHADWLIPGVHFLEREETNPLLQAINAEPFAQMGRAVVDKPEGMMDEWEFLRDVGLEMDVPLIEGKRWLNGPLKFSRWLAKVTNNPALTFNPNLIAKVLVGKGGRVKWKDLVNAEHGIKFGEVEYDGFYKGLQTPGGKVQASPKTFMALLSKAYDSTPEEAVNQQFPLRLITRRKMHMMNSWLGETAMTAMPKREGDRVEINPQDCQTLNLQDGQTVQVESATATVNAIVTSSDKIRPGVVVMEHGWGGHRFSPKTGQTEALGGVNRNLLVSNNDLSDLAAVPRLNGTPVKIIAA